jgi:quercetin dioxygenase-like cupin family protein
VTDAVDLGAGSGRGPLWGAASEDLNATLLGWGAGESVEEHVNAVRDVLYVVVRGSGTLTVDGEAHAVVAPAAVLVEKGRSRALVAGPDGIRYVTAHVRRPPLQIRAVG